MSGPSNGSTNLNPKSLQTLAFQAGRTLGNTVLHQYVLDHSEHDYSCNECSKANIGCILLLMYDAPVNVLNHEKYSPLHLAVRKNNVLMVENLLSCLKNRIDVNIKGLFGKTPLHMAVENRYKEVVQKIAQSPRNSS